MRRILCCRAKLDRLFMPPRVAYAVTARNRLTSALVLACTIHPLAWPTDSAHVLRVPTVKQRRLSVPLESQLAVVVGQLQASATVQPAPLRRLDWPVLRRHVDASISPGCRSRHRIV